MATQLRVGSVTPRFFQTITLTPTAVPANSLQRETYTVNGLFTDMLVDVNQPVPDNTGLVVLGCRVSAANTLELTWWNSTNASITPAAAQGFFVIGY